MSRAQRSIALNSGAKGAIESVAGITWSRDIA